MSVGLHNQQSLTLAYQFQKRIGRITDLFGAVRTCAQGRLGGMTGPLGRRLIADRLSRESISNGVDGQAGRC